MGLVAGLHPGRYASAEYARLERELLWASWQPACHVSDLPTSGTALRIDVAGRSAILLRGRDQSIRAFLNVCSHRGSRLVDGDPRTGLAFCVGGRMRCPYHAWEYDDTGALAHVPQAEAYPGLDPAALGLKECAVETWLGFVFIAFERPARRVAECLEPIREELEPGRFEALRRLSEPQVLRCQADWKLLVEQGLDVRHLDVARPGLKPRVTGPVAIEARGDHVLTLSAPIEAAPSARWSERGYVHWLPETDERPAPLRRRRIACFLWPNSAIVVSPDRVVLMRVLPAQPGQSVLRTVAYAHPDPRREMRIARYLNQRVTRQAQAQDRRLVERVQLGVASGDATQGPIAADETGLRWFVERMRAAIPDVDDGRGRVSRARRRTR